MSDVVVGIKARLAAEQEAASAAERDIRDADGRYKRATANAKALKTLLELFELYAANDDFGPVDIPF